MSDLKMVQAKIYRIISNRRAIKLRKRGEFVKWSVELNSYIWEPDWLAPNPVTDDGLPWVSHAEYKRLSA
jgi:hypothetical protein